ncbi:MAG: HD domain-containing phosphohydrolase [Candidatus Velthaea sp.]|jgi:HD-GYP domain-containing protein (c-di-GMP phosphodiesterase class II)
MSIVERAAIAKAGNSSFVMVYPSGLALPPGVCDALEAAGIRQRAGGFPYAGEHGDDEHAVYLIDLERLRTLGPRPVIEQALLLVRLGQDATTVVLAPAGDPDLGWLATNPHVGGWLTGLDPAAVTATIRTAGSALALDAEARRLRAAAGERIAETEQLLRIGVALSAERDIEKLRETIVRSARELTQADSGSLFLLETDPQTLERSLRFAVAQTGPCDAGTHVGAVLPLSRASISGYVALTGEVVRLDDAYAIGDAHEYRFNSSFDQKNNYRTKSVCCVPMRDHSGNVVGSIMLINRKPDFGLLLQSPEHTARVAEPFEEHHERVLLSLASQAAVALENDALLASIQDLFEQFVRASVKAIEVRDKATQGHSARVAELSVRQAQTINRIEAGPFAGVHFDADQLRELRYAALLHDFGKVAVPEYIFGKAKKLPDGRLDTVRLRFAVAIEQIESQAGRKIIDLMGRGTPVGDPRFAQIESERDLRMARLRELFAAVEDANEPRVVPGDVAGLLEGIANLTYRDLDAEKPLLDAHEIDYLRIARGSLSAQERCTMEQHVTQSFHFLREIPWSQTPWPLVPEYAYGHHEHLDGSGYPRGLRGDQIAPQVRLLTISDVFDALTANDRPYKPAMPLEKALDVLVEEFAERGKIDRALLDLFIANKVYEPVLAARDAANDGSGA